MKEDLKNKGPGYVIASSGVEVRQIESQTLTDALGRLQRNWKLTDLENSS